MLFSRTLTFFAFLDFRNEAKILNYGRIYGGGVLFAAQLLRNFNPSLSDLEAERRARNMYQVTKGDRKYEMSDIAKHLYQILYGDTNFEPVVKKTLKVLHLTKVLLDTIMETYKDMDNLIMNENGHTIVHDLEMPLSDDNQIELKDLRIICEKWIKKKTKFNPNPGK